MENPMPGSSTSGALAFVDESTTNRHNNRLSDFGRAKLLEWRVFLAGRIPTTNEKNSFLEKIHLNNEDRWYTLVNLNSQLKRWDAQKSTAASTSENGADLYGMMYPDISAEERSLYKALVLKYPDNYLIFLGTVRNTRKENASLEKVQLLCKTIHEFCILEQSSAASGSGNSSRITAPNQVVQTRGRPRSSTVRAPKPADHRSRTNTGRHLPTPSNSSSPEVPLMALPSDTFCPATEQGSLYVSELGSPLLLNFQSAISRDSSNRNSQPSPQTIPLQNTQPSQLIPSALIHPIAGVKRRRSTSPPPTPLSTSYKQHAPLTPASIRSSESPFVARSPFFSNPFSETSFKDVKHNRHSLTNVPPNSSSFATASSNAPLPVHNQRNDFSVLFSSDDLEKKEEISSPTEMSMLEGPRSATYANNENVPEQPQFTQSVIAESLPKTGDEFDEWFSYYASELRQQLGIKEIAPKTEAEFEELFSASEHELREWMETLKKE